MDKELPHPTVVRLCGIYRFLGTVDAAAVVSSTELGEKIGIPSHTIRKDLNFLGGIGNVRSGYEVGRLKSRLAEYLGFDREHAACVVGLGQIGGAFIQNPGLVGEGFRIVAGFDSSINRLETIAAAVPVFPSYEITETVRRLGVELGILTVPASAAQEAADRLIDGGVRGIVNYAPVIIKPKSGLCHVRNMDITGELRVLTAMVELR